MCIRDRKKIPYLIVGNKSDLLEDNRLSAKQFEELLNDYHTPEDHLILVSANTCLLYTSHFSYARITFHCVSSEIAPVCSVVTMKEIIIVIIPVIIPLPADVSFRKMLRDCFCCHAK